jgi:hypothetical protein
MRFYNQPHAYYCGVDLHAGSMFAHVLDHGGATSSPAISPPTAHGIILLLGPQCHCSRQREDCTAGIRLRLERITLRFSRASVGNLASRPPAGAHESRALGINNGSRPNSSSSLVVWEVLPAVATNPTSEGFSVRDRPTLGHPPALKDATEHCLEAGSEDASLGRAGIPDRIACRTCRVSSRSKSFPCALPRGVRRFAQKKVRGTPWPTGRDGKGLIVTFAIFSRYGAHRHGQRRFDLAATEAFGRDEVHASFHLRPCRDKKTEGGRRRKVLLLNIKRRHVTFHFQYER